MTIPSPHNIHRSFQAIEAPQAKPQIGSNLDKPFDGPDMWRGEMSALHYGDLNAPVRLVFLHANGFNGLAYRSILEPLSRELGIQTIALDLRGHGFTTLRDTPGRFSNFYAYARDVCEYLDRHVEGKVILSGHSLGASTAILTAKLAKDRVERVVAFDPIVLPWIARAIMATKIGRNHFKNKLPMAKSAGRRRDVFDSFDQVFSRFVGRGTFKEFPDATLWDYIYGGFTPINEVQNTEALPNANASVRLTCRPEWEQYTYISQSHDLLSAVQVLPKNSHIQITDFVKQSAWLSKMAHKRPDLKLEHFKGKDHFFPLINTDISINALRQSLQVFS